MKLDTTQSAAVALAVVLVLVAVWMARSTPPPATPVPTSIEELMDEPSVPKAQTSLGESPAEVDEDAFTTIAPGLAVAVLRQGVGKNVASGDIALVRYALWTKDGLLIDASHDKRRPFKFRVGAGQVVPGWDRAMTQVDIGSTIQLRISAALGYGTQGQDNRVPPDTDLILDLQVRGVEEPRIAPTATPDVPVDDWTDLGDGLSGADLDVGAGQLAAAGLTASFEFTVWLTDGTRVDSSLLRGAPATSKLGTYRIVRGYEQGMMGMREGGRRLLRVPPALAYGAEGRGDIIPPDAELVVELRLLSLTSDTE